MDNPGEDFAWYREQCNTSVAIAVKDITLAFSEWDNEAPLPVSRDDTSVTPGPQHL